MVGDPGATSGLLTLFCGRLKRLQMASGISQSRLLGIVHLGRSQMSDILNGKIKRLPDWDVTIAMVRACLEYAEASSRPVPPDLRDEGDWRRRYADLEYDLDAESRQGSHHEMLPGRLLAQVIDPFVLEVHRPVQPDTPQPGLPALPAYVPREHDAELERVVMAAAQGDSGIAVLVGGSSTGKTRACWEALRLLRDEVKPWRLWHPIDPSRPEAALRELHSIGPRTVIWLNEAQFYLDASGGLGERVAAGLRELLRDPAKAPVLVLATLWPRFWDQLTAGSASGPDDPRAQARELLTGRDITVPAAFAEAQLWELHGAADPRLAQAARAAEGGQVIQFLAGAPELLARYRNAPPAAAALIGAAMDARRLGMGVALPLAFLHAAAPGYLTDTDWDGLGEDWLEQALAYTAVPCKGVRGLLTRIRPRPARPSPIGRDKQLADGQVSIAGMPLYRLADYLDQHGRRQRNDQLPPADFWAAATDHALPAEQATLGDAAHDRGLYRDAAQLHKNAAAKGNLHAVSYLSNPPDLLHLDTRPIRWAIDHAPLDTPGAVDILLHSLQETGTQDQVTALLARDPATQIPLDHARDVAQLLDWLRDASAQDQVATLLARNPAAHASLDDPVAVAMLLGSLREAGAQDQVTALLARDPAVHIPLGYPIPVAMVLDSLREASAQDQVAVLAARAAAHASLPGLMHVTALLNRLLEPDTQDQVAVLAARAAAHVPLDHPGGVAWLLDRLLEAGAQDQMATLLARDPAAHVPLDDPDAVAWLLDSLREAGAHDQVTALLARDHAAHVPFEYPEAVTRVLQSLLEADTQDQVAALAHDLSAYVDLDHPGNVAWLLDTLRQAGAQDQVTVLARDLVPQVLLDHSPYVDILLASLREAGAQDQVTALVGRLPAAGMFELFRQQEGYQDRFRFGREADGTPAEPWSWEDLD